MSGVGGAGTSIIYIYRLKRISGLNKAKGPY